MKLYKETKDGDFRCLKCGHEEEYPFQIITHINTKHKKKGDETLQKKLF